MYRALPGADYYEGSVPSRRHQRTLRLACPEGRRRQREGSHVHCRSIGGLVTSYAPAGLPRRSRSHSSRTHNGRIHAAEGRTPRNPQGARAPHGQPISIGFEPATSLAGVLPLVHLRYTVSALLAAPTQSGGPCASRRCQGCSRPHPQLRGQAALSFTGPLRQPGGGALHPTRSDSASWRTNSSR